jgi:hypothetical protein
MDGLARRLTGDPRGIEPAGQQTLLPQVFDHFCNFVLKVSE